MIVFDNPTLRGAIVKKIRLLLLAAGLIPIAQPAVGADISFSGFGTVGYTQSDQSYAYQRFIDNSGSFKRDSVFGVQMDAQITPQISFTVQGKVAPSMNNDSSWDPTVAWAFVSWRPTSDWLLRLGKLKVPSYLNAENMDVGATFDFARLPYEVYSASPTTDFTGASFNKVWNLDDNEITLDGYWGKAKTDWRFYFRDTIPGVQNAGAYYWPVNVDSKGLVLSLRQDENIYRVGMHRAIATVDKLFPVTFPYDTATLAPTGIGFYQVSGPAVPWTRNINLNLYSMAADVGLGNDFRFAGEYVRRAVKDTDLGPDSQSAYISLRKRIDKWTPYIIHSRLRSESKPLDMKKALNNSSVPAAIDGFAGPGAAAMINASQRAGADGIIAYDQYSNSLGVSYAMSPTSKIKVDWTSVHIGEASSMVDVPLGTDIRQKAINVLSLSYSFVY